MQIVKGWYLPDEDTHIAAFLEREGHYQLRQRKAALKYVKERNVVIDIGAHVGLWAKDFCRKFKRVYLFEPNQNNLPCLNANLCGFHNWRLHLTALGNYTGQIEFYTKYSNSAASRVTSVENYDGKVTVSKVPITTLDSYKIFDVSLIKIDVEGYELQVLEGARQTLLRSRPVVVFEEKILTREPRLFVESLGFKFQMKVGSECIYCM